MYRYFILIWNPRDAAASASARLLAERMISRPLGWARVLEGPGLYAFHAGLGEAASRTWLLCPCSSRARASKWPRSRTFCEFSR